MSKFYNETIASLLYEDAEVTASVENAEGKKESVVGQYNKLSKANSLASILAVYFKGNESELVDTLVNGGIDIGSVRPKVRGKLISAFGGDAKLIENQTKILVKAGMSEDAARDLAIKVIAQAKAS
jgi:hypothetical protein